MVLMELLAQHQVATPPTVMLADAGDLPRAMDELGFPPGGEDPRRPSISP
jgi:hypothetical protein